MTRIPPRRASLSRIAALAVLLAPAGAGADVEWIAEGLGDGACDTPGCLVTGEDWVTGVGWRVTSVDSQIVIDLSSRVPDGIACGALVLELTSLDPVGHLVGDSGYVHVGALYEGPHGNPWTASANDEAQLQISGKCEECVSPVDPDAIWKQHRLEFKALLCSWEYDQVSPYCGGDGEGNRYVPDHYDASFDWPATLASRYTATVTWGCAGLTYQVTDGVGTWTSAATWAPHPGSDPRPRFRTLFLGRDNKPGAVPTWLQDLVIVRASVVEHSSCDCPAGPATDGGLPAGDAGGPHADAAGTPDDGGPSGRDGAGDDAAAPGSDDGIGGDCGCRLAERRRPRRAPGALLGLAVATGLALGRRARATARAAELAPIPRGLVRSPCARPRGARGSRSA